MLHALVVRKTKTNIYVIVNKDNQHRHFQQSGISEAELSQLSQSRFKNSSFDSECMSLKSVAPSIRTVTFSFF